MPADWQNMVFSEQAQFLIDQFEGLTKEDVDILYDEWSTREYPDGLVGRTEALNDLVKMAQRRYLGKNGKLEQFDQRIEDEVRRLGQTK